MYGTARAPNLHERSDDERIAVIDIGSNSVRLVVYDGRGRASQAIFNEKAACGLGVGISQTGSLSDEGIACATRALDRFARVARALDVQVIDAFATAAVREAENGAWLLERIRRLTGLDVEVLSGEEEGRLSAEGVLASIPGVDGAMGDIGGGSLELVALDQGKTGACTTMPVGILRLAGPHGGDLVAIRKTVRQALRQAAWLPELKGRTFVAVGGGWRALARVYMNVTKAPLHIVHQLSVPALELKKFLRAVVKGAHQGERAVRGLSRRRVEALPTAALLLSEVIERGKPAEVRFSAYGVREGRLLRHFTPAERARDPLFAACAEFAADTPRFHLSPDDVFTWASPLFPDEAEDRRRLRYAACLAGDIGWREHPDYRPEQVFQRLLLMPAVGIDHVGRAHLATTLYARYSHHLDAPCLAVAHRLLSDEAFEAAALAGGALRLAYEISGGDPELLRQTHVGRAEDTLVLHLGLAAVPLVGETAERRLGQIAKRLALNSKLITGEIPASP